MSTFAARMREAKLTKAARRSRGEACGNHRGTLRVRTDADIYRGYDEMELGIAALVQATVRDPLHAFSQDLAAIVLELNDASILDMPF
jgi:hypothetical protein